MSNKIYKNRGESENELFEPKNSLKAILLKTLLGSQFLQNIPNTLK